MELKRFYADDMGAGLTEVKRTLGGDAVIVATSRAGRGIEIVAATDYDEKLYRELVGRQEAPVEVDALELQQELTELRNTLKEELARLSRMQAQPAPVAAPAKADPVRARLEQLGLASNVADKLAAALAGSGRVGWKETLQAVGNQLRVADDPVLELGGVYAMLGSTGVGKTTTAAKLAARYCRRHGKGKVALISTDSYRIGGQEQLAGFARAIGAPLETAANARELKYRLREFRNYELVLIDTAGMGQRDMMLGRHLQSIGECGEEIRPLLVLSGVSHVGVNLEIVAAFEQLPIKGVVVTKVDEATSLGPALTTLIRHRLPLAYVCDGQEIPEDLAPADKRQFLLKAHALALPPTPARRSTQLAPVVA